MADNVITLPTPTPVTAGEVQEGAYSVAGQVLSIGSNFVQILDELANTSSISVEVPFPEVEFLQEDGPVLSYLDTYRAARPIFPSILVPIPDAPVTTFSSAEDITVEDFTSTAPALNIPATPSTALPAVPASPTIADPILPDAPILNFPTAPTFATVNLPLPPSVDIPSFTAGLPSEDFLTPTNNFTWYEQVYSSDLLTELQSKLLGDLQNGGYGIETADEVALFNRARDRELEAAMMEVDEIRRSAAARGFPLPPGELYIAEQKAQQALQNKLSGVNRDIALKRADMYVENRRFAMEQTKNVEQILIGFHNSIQERALNYAKLTLDAAIRIYEAQLQRYNARLEAYKAEAQVFESRIRAALAQTEIYRTQMDGARLELESQKTQAEIYRTQIQGIDAVVNVYKTRMEAVRVQSDIERMRLEAFRAAIDAYQAQVQAKVAEFQMYDAQIRGETAKMQAYEIEARAYTAKVEGTKVRADISLGNLRQETDKARAQIDVYRGQLQASELILKTQTDSLRANTDIYQADTQAFNASSSALAEYLRLEQLRGSTNKDMVIRAAGIQLEQVKTLLTQLSMLFDVKIKSSGTAIEYLKATVAAALSQLNAITSKAE